MSRTWVALWLSCCLGGAIVGCEGDGGAAAPFDGGDARSGDVAGPDGGGGDASAAGGLCDDEPEPVPPVGMDDADYEVVDDHMCAAGPPTEGLCFCDGAMAAFVRSLLACEPTGGGGYWGQGSVYARAVGRRNGACRLQIGVEMEGAVQIWDCAVPLPVRPWSGLGTSGDTSQGAPSFLAGIEPYCTRAGDCCVIAGCPGACGDDAPYCGVVAGPNLACGP